MSVAGNKKYDIYINSANRALNDKSYDFSLLFDAEEITVKPNEGINVSVVSFSMLNSMYNVNSNIGNTTFTVKTGESTLTTITIPAGNYDVYSFMAQLNILFNSVFIETTYNTATNTYTYTSKNATIKSIIPQGCNKLLGLSGETVISQTGTQSTYINMVNYQQVVLKCPSLVFDNYAIDNISNSDNALSISDIIFWVNKQDVEPFKNINYKNEDGGTLYSYNVLNRSINVLNFKMTNEYNQPILDAPEFLIQLQINVFDKDTKYFKESCFQALKLLNEIYFILLNFVSFISKFKRKK